MGCRPEAVQVVGNLKFDAAQLAEHRQLDVPALLRQIGVPEDALLVVAGSTHDGEEIILAEMAARLRAQFPKLFLILVPRHFERARDIGQQFRARGVRFILRSEIIPATQLRPGEVDMPAGQHDRRIEVFLRTGARGVRRQKPDGHRRAESDRAGGAGQAGGFRPEHAEFSGHRADLPQAQAARCR